MAVAALTAQNEADAGRKSQFLSTTPAFDASFRGGGFPSKCCHDVWYGKLEWCGCQMVKKCEVTITHFDRMCESNRRTDTLTPQGRACIPSRDKMSCIRYRQCSLSRMLWNKRTYRLIVLGTCACRAMLCKRGLCRHAMSVCLSVCPSVCVSADTLANSVKTNTHIFKCFFHHWVAKQF